MADMDQLSEVISPAAVANVADMVDIKSVAPKPSASKKKVAGTKQRKSAVSDEHPKYSVMIADAISQLKERGGSSRQAILRYITSNYRVGTETNKINARVKMSLKAGVKSGLLNQSKGTGATGSFRLGQRQKSSQKTARPRSSTGSGKTAANKPKTAVGKPKSPAKKTTLKKSKAKSMTKVKSPAKKTKAPAKKTKAPAKKMKTAASKAKPKSATKIIKQKTPVKKTAGKK